MTSNIGVRDLKDYGAGIGFSTKAKQESMDEAMKGTIQSALKKAFSPEFLNRLDDVIVFNSLSRENIHKIIDISLTGVLDRIEKLGYKIELTAKAKDFIAEKGYDPQYGARPLNRAIQKYLEDPVAEEILNGGVSEGGTLQVDFDEKSKELKFKVKGSKSSKPPKEDDEKKEDKSKEA